MPVTGVEQAPVRSEEDPRVRRQRLARRQAGAASLQEPDAGSKTSTLRTGRVTGPAPTGAAVRESTATFPSASVTAVGCARPETSAPAGSQAPARSSPPAGSKIRASTGPLVTAGAPGAPGTAHRRRVRAGQRHGGVRAADGHRRGERVAPADDELAAVLELDDVALDAARGGRERHTGAADRQHPGAGGTVAVQDAPVRQDGDGGGNQRARGGVDEGRGPRPDGHRRGDVRGERLVSAVADAATTASGHLPGMREEPACLTC